VACETFEADSAPIMNAFFLSHALKVAESVLNDSGIKKKDNSEDYEVILSNDTKPVNENKSVKEEIKTPKGHKSLLEHLFSFVETDQELNPVLAGYFNKVVQVLLKRNPRRVRKLSL